MFSDAFGKYVLATLWWTVFWDLSKGCARKCMQQPSMLARCTVFLASIGWDDLLEAMYEQCKLYGHWWTMYAPRKSFVLYMYRIQSMLESTSL